MKNLKVINKSLEEKDVEVLKAILTQSPDFPWYFNDGVNKQHDGHIQFLHTFYSNFSVNSEWMSIVEPILKILNPLSIIRIKANLLGKTNEIIEHGMHVDQTTKTNNKQLKTAIYYVNNNNGYTKFKNGKKILSEENKLIIFDNDELHTGTTCTDEKTRVVINFNYVEK
jgi:hypothetical protein